MALYGLLVHAFLIMNTITFHKYTTFDFSICQLKGILDNHLVLVIMNKANVNIHVQVFV